MPKYNAVEANGTSKPNGKRSSEPVEKTAELRLGDFKRGIMTIEKLENSIRYVTDRVAPDTRSTGGTARWRPS